MSRTPAPGRMSSPTRRGKCEAYGPFCAPISSVGRSVACAATKRSSVMRVNFAESARPSRLADGFVRILDVGIVPSRIGAVNRWIRVVPPVVAVLAASVAAAYLLQAIPHGTALNLVSGVWLALARDARDGVFYRALAGDGLYGGTRYFPLLFLTIAGFMRVGLSAMRAGQIASLLGGMSAAVGVFVYLRCEAV